MTKIKQSPKLPAEKRQQQLLDAARKLFLSKGYRETSIDEVAKAAGLTKGAVYFHFKNKEDILYSLMLRMSDRYLATYDDFPDQKASATELFRALISHRKELSIGKSGNVMDFWGQAMSHARVRKMMVRQARIGLERFVEALDPTCFRDRQEVRELAVFTLSLVDGLMVRNRFMETKVDQDRQMKLYERLIESYCTDKRVRRRK